MASVPPEKSRESWSMFEAKARFSELVRRAREEGPQLVTNRGEPAVYVIPAENHTQAGKPMRKELFGLHKGQTRILGDIISPLDVEWDAMK